MIGSSDIVAMDATDYRYFILFVIIYYFLFCLLFYLFYYILFYLFIFVIGMRARNCSTAKRDM